MQTDVFQQFENGTLITEECRIDLANRAWNRHTHFAGVFIKHMATEEQTGGLFTCHLVRIEPQCSIGKHAHPVSVEVHEVVQGSGVCLTNQGEIPYVPGVMAILAPNAPHEVRAGEDGLCLFAKFITVPA